MHSSCTECGRLRLIHEETIRAHTEVILRYQQAKLRGDRTAVASIEPMVNMASEDRDRAHRAILAHVGIKTRSQAG